MWSVNVLHLHGTEGAEADVKRDKGDAHTLFPHLVQQLRREMQAGRGSRCGAALPGIDILIPLLILEFRA